VNLKEWAKAQGVHPHAAYRWFREGTLPVPATWVGPRTILVNVEANAAPEAVGGVGLYARVSSQEQQAVGAGAGGARRQAPGEHPAPLADLANAGHGRYVLACRVVFPHRGQEWADRITADRAVAYTIDHDPDRDRWYLTASWRRAAPPVIPLDAALAAGCIGVDTNHDHLAAWRLDPHRNPIGEPRRFPYALSGSADHRDAQIRPTSPACCTGPTGPACRPSRWKTWTSTGRRPARGTADASGSGG